MIPLTCDQPLEVPPEEPHPSPFVIRQHADWGEKCILTCHFQRSWNRMAAGQAPHDRRTTRVPDQMQQRASRLMTIQDQLPKATGRVHSAILTWPWRRSASGSLTTRCTAPMPRHSNTRLALVRPVDAHPAPRTGPAPSPARMNPDLVRGSNIQLRGE